MCISVYFYVNISFMFHTFNSIVLFFIKGYHYVNVYFIVGLRAYQRFYPILGLGRTLTKHNFPKDARGKNAKKRINKYINKIIK